MKNKLIISKSTEDDFYFNKFICPDKDHFPTVKPLERGTVNIHKCPSCGKITVKNYWFYIFIGYSTYMKIKKEDIKVRKKLPSYLVVSKIFLDKRKKKKVKHKKKIQDDL